MVASISMSRVAQVSLCLILLVALAHCHDFEDSSHERSLKQSGRCRYCVGYQYNGTWEERMSTRSTCGCRNYCYNTYSWCRYWYWDGRYCYLYRRISGRSTCWDCHYGERRN